MMTAATVDAQITRDGFYYEARRYCDERDIDFGALPRIEAALRHRAFMEAIQPVLRMKARVMGLAMPNIIFRPDGTTVTVHDSLRDTQRESLAQADELIADIARQHGLGQDTPPG